MQLQYIGARYVPIWYKNSLDDSANWEVNVEYEPLTFVTSENNHLYLSKKTVPDNIGSPALNTEYWLDLGVFITGQYELLQNQINDMKDGDVDGSLQNQIDKIDTIINFINRYSNKKFVVYGDSLSSYDTNWITPFTEFVESIGGTVTNHSYPGATAANQLTEAQQDSNVYDVAIVWIGMNDSHLKTTLGPVTTSGTFSYIYNSLLTAIHSTSPNCDIYCFGTSFSSARSLLFDRSTYFYNNCIKDVAYLRGCVYKSLDMLPHNGSGDNTATSDGTHFTEEYSKGTLFYTFINKLCNPGSENNVKKIFTAYDVELLDNIQTGISIVSYSIRIDPEGLCNINILFDTSGLTAQQLFDIKNPIRPETALFYEIGNNYIVSFSHNTGGVQTNYVLPDGRYDINFTFVPKWVTSFILREST